MHKAGTLASKLRATVELAVCDTKATSELRIASQMSTQAAAASSTLLAWLEYLAGPLRANGIEVSTSAITGVLYSARCLNGLRIVQRT